MFTRQVTVVEPARACASTSGESSPVNSVQPCSVAELDPWDGLHSRKISEPVVAPVAANVLRPGAVPGVGAASTSWPTVTEIRLARVFVSEPPGPVTVTLTVNVPARL